MGKADVVDYLFEEKNSNCDRQVHC
jgi:hypothetical protein